MRTALRAERASQIALLGHFQAVPHCGTVIDLDVLKVDFILITVFL
jgi:hypothetical protein